MAVQINGTSGISGVDGSASTPALQGSDSNTGISFGTDEVSINTGGTTRAKVDSSGRLGVGTTSPSSLLHLSGANTASRGQLSVAGASAGARTTFYQDSTFIGQVTGDTTNGIQVTTEPTYPLKLGTAGSTAIHIDTSQRVGIGVTPTYKFDIASSAANSYIGFHENTANTVDDNIFLWRMGANANSASATFVYCQTSTTQRIGLRGNGGIANYSANNVNLSDINVKKDISSADSTWDCLKDWEIVNFRYKDHPDDADLTMGVIAQQVAVNCPEVITVFQEAKEATDTEPAQEERLGVKEQQMMWMAIKALQEAQIRIETLETRLAALEGGN